MMAFSGKIIMFPYAVRLLHCLQQKPSKSKGSVRKTEAKEKGLSFSRTISISQHTSWRENRHLMYSRSRTQRYTLEQQEKWSKMTVTGGQKSTTTTRTRYPSCHETLESKHKTDRARESNNSCAFICRFFRGILSNIIMPSTLRRERGKSILHFTGNYKVCMNFSMALAVLFLSWMESSTALFLRSYTKTMLLDNKVINGWYHLPLPSHQNVHEIANIRDAFMSAHWLHFIVVKRKEYIRLSNAIFLDVNSVSIFTCNRFLSISMHLQYSRTL